MKKNGLVRRIISFFTIIALVTIIVSAAVTYVNQTIAYHEECVNNLRQITDHIIRLMENEGDELAVLKDYFSEHQDQVKIPLDFRADLEKSKRSFYKYCRKHYKGRVPGSGLEYDEMDDEAMRRFVIYRFEYWLSVYFDAVDDFDLKYMYFGFPIEEKDHTINFMFEPALDTVTADDGSEILLLGEEIYEDPDIHKYMWQAWEKGSADYVDVMDNEYGFVYTYCQPLIIDGEKIGLLCVDTSVSGVTSAITTSVVRQVIVTSIVFILAAILLFIFVRSKLIRRILNLDNKVEKYSEEKDPEISN